MIPVYIDFETYYSTTHSLSKMNPIEYVMHPDTELQSVSVKVGNAPTDVIFGEQEIIRHLKCLDWSNKIAIGHNMSGFDALILVWRCGINPAMFGCTAAMARSKYAKTCGVSLKALSKELGIGVKGSLEATNTKGKRLADFTAEELHLMEVYNKQDTELCAKLFKELARITPQREMYQIDMTTRALVEAQFVVDTDVIGAALEEVKESKRQGLLKLAEHLGIEKFAPGALEGTSIEEQLRSTLASTAKFKELLEGLGVDVPMKPSPTNPNKQVPALAKTDEALTSLVEHANPVVSAAARCRLEVKSTLLETRLQAFRSTAKLCGGKLPVPLKYSGADTTGRWSGELYNCFTGDVEVLTRSGWVRFDAWDGSPIMQWWPDGRATFEESPGYLRKPHEGDVVDVRGVLLDATMTPDHRLVSVRGHRLVERTAGWLAASSGLDGIPAAGTWPGEATSVFTPDEVRLLVAIAADGCVAPRKTQRPTVQIGLRKARKVERLHALLKAVGCQYTVREYPPQVGHSGDHPTTYFFLKDCPYSKGFGPWILRLSREALDALVDELPHWDGWKHQKTGSDEFCTSDKEQAEWVATAWHLSGTPSTVRQYMGTRYQLHRRQSSLTSVSRSDVTVRSFYGDVFCASVKSTYIFIRRHGKIAVVGQCQNLPRIKRNKKTKEIDPQPSNALRLCMHAPKGHLVGVADQSGIELRVNHFLWKVEESMQMFSDNPLADLYRAFAAARYGIAPEAVDDAQRFLGKVAQLGLGFGSGAATFRKVARLMGGIRLSEEEAAQVVYAWRDKYPEIVGGWQAFQNALPAIERGDSIPIDPWGMCVTEKDAVRLPSGRRIYYPNLHRERDSETGKWEWWYGQGRHRARIYAGKGVENMVQALARDIVADCALDFWKRTGFRWKSMVHDELVYIWPEARAAALLEELQSIMRQPPKWWPELVTWSEGDVALSYGLAK